ncbi:MAG: sulfurtransferase TusA family protein [gamma proteobacterium endosymbiont of Lamellibrachia anaximandri]|nr:sulfurtransferase TusA family protein [gamma proteobacterium endosymbiont of Lamellibrachia anaximandri]
MATQNFDQELNVSGLDCPLPIIRTKAAFARMDSGQILQIKATNPEFTREVRVLTAHGLYELIDESITAQQLIYLVRKK